jgi:hypothetical protein
MEAEVMERQELPDHGVPLERQERRASLVLLVPLASLARQVLMVIMERQER